MSRNPFFGNAFGTLLCFIIAVIFIAYIPYKILSRGGTIAIAEIAIFKFLGPVFIVAGFIGFLPCYWRFIVEAKGSPMQGNSQNLIVKGLYRHVRNPIYLSAFFILLGQAVFFQSLPLFYYFLGSIFIFHGVVVFIEEPSLHVQFGKDYDRYCRSVPRWIPRLRPVKKGEQARR